MLRLIVEAEGLEGEALAALLRREGVYESELRAWREAAHAAISPTTEGGASPESAAHRKEVAAIKSRMKQLERELRRKDRALAEAAALLVLEKKLQALGWDAEQSQGDEDDELDEKNES
jgi:transposase